MVVGPLVVGLAVVLEKVDVVANIAKINASNKLTNRGGDCVCLHCSPILLIFVAR